MLLIQIARVGGPDMVCRPPTNELVLPRARKRPVDPGFCFSRPSPANTPRPKKLLRPISIASKGRIKLGGSRKIASVPTKPSQNPIFVSTTHDFHLVFRPAPYHVHRARPESSLFPVKKRFPIPGRALRTRQLPARLNMVNASAKAWWISPRTVFPAPPTASPGPPNNLLSLPASLQGPKAALPVNHFATTDHQPP